MPPELAGLGEPGGKPSAPCERFGAPVLPLKSVGVLGAAGDTCDDPDVPLVPLASPLLVSLVSLFLFVSLFPLVPLSPLESFFPLAPLLPLVPLEPEDFSVPAAAEEPALFATFVLATVLGHFDWDNMLAGSKALVEPFMPQKPGILPILLFQATPGVSVKLDAAEEPDEPLPDSVEPLAPEAPEAP